MAAAEKITEKVVKGVNLDLDPIEAGCLLDLLMAHVGGPATKDREPLGRIRVALLQAEVQRAKMENTNRYKVADRYHSATVNLPFSLCDND